MKKISLLSAALVIAALPAFAQTTPPAAAVSTDTHMQTGKTGISADAKTQASDSKDSKDKAAQKKLPPQVAQHPGASDQTDATVKPGTMAKPDATQKPDAGK
jgi:hypothetical protein